MILGIELLIFDTKLVPCVPFHSPWDGQDTSVVPPLYGHCCWVPLLAPPSKHPLMLCCVKVAFWCLGLPLGLADLIYLVFLYCAPYSFMVHLTFFFTTSVALQSLS